MNPGDVTCNEVVELASDYLDGLVDELEHAIDAHVDGCPGCRAYLDQMRRTIRLLGDVGREQISPDLLGSLLRQFRGEQTR
jgi:predicted anti-sigma-YlaC factor YlaD